MRNPWRERVAVLLERGGLTAKKNGDADAFGFYERTPSLPYAANQNPRFEKNRPFHAGSITGLFDELARGVTSG